MPTFGRIPIHMAGGGKGPPYKGPPPTGLGGPGGPGGTPYGGPPCRWLGGPPPGGPQKGGPP